MPRRVRGESALGEIDAASRKADELRGQGNTVDADKFDNLAKIALQRQISEENEAKAIAPTIAAQTEVVERLAREVDRWHRIAEQARLPDDAAATAGLSQEQLERLKKQKLPTQAKWIINTTYKNGTRMFNIADPAESIFMVRPDRRKLLPLSYDAPLSTEWWDDDGSQTYREMFARIQKRGVVLEKPGSKD